MLRIIKHILVSTLFIAFAVPAGNAFANEFPLGLGIFLGGNVTNGNGGKNREVHGTGFEGGGAAMFSQFHLIGFVKQVQFTSTETEENGDKTIFKFSDSMTGYGARFLGRAYSIKAGKAMHKTSSSEKKNEVDTENKNLPDGRDSGVFYGAGLWMPLPDNLLVMVEYTRYELPETTYHVEDISLVVTLQLSGPSAAAAPKSSGKK